MGENSAISWTHHTWNPWWGCHRVSPGCEHCYAETFAKRTGHNVWGRTAERRFLADPFKALAKMQHKAYHAGERHRVFIASMADIFEAHPTPEVRARQDAIRAELWALVPSLTSLDLLLLTKRPQNVREMVPAEWMAGGFPRNIWLGTTCEDQQRADERLLHLLGCPAAVRWVSYEPALGPINFKRWLNMPEPRMFADDPLAGHLMAEALRDGHGDCRRALDWIVVGGESGGGARPFDVGWARSTVAQCRGAAVPCFVKQMGSRPIWCSACRGRGYGLGTDFGLFECPECGGDGTVFGEPGEPHPLRLRDAKGGDIDEWPEELRVRQYPEVEHA